MKSEYVLIHAAPIKHYGIKGQKKGVRRFQLDNGQLTAAGKVRYYNSKDFFEDHYEKNKNGGRPYTTPYDYESPEEKAQRAMKNAKMVPTWVSYDRFNKAYSKMAGHGHGAMEKASNAAGINGRALTGALGKKVDKKTSSISTETPKTSDSWGKRIAAVNEKPPIASTKKETKNNLGNNGGRPYSTPYTQTVASGRKKNVTGSTVGASKNDKLTLEEKAPAATVGAKTQGAILKAHNAVRVTTQNKSGNSSGNKQLASPVKVDKDKLSSRGNEKIRDNVEKVGADLADIASDRAKQIDVITKTQNLLGAASKAGKQMDNGAVDTLKKKKDLVKIKSGKNTRR